MQTIKQQIPNLFTLGNLLCGCLAIKFAFEWDLVMAAYLVGLGAVLDFFDGFLARILKVQGEMGKQLDSLADMVTFGVVPGVVMFQMMRITGIFYFLENEGGGHFISQRDGAFVPDLSIEYYAVSLIAFLIPLLSAYRLAKFNIDTRQTDKFIGLPTPANSIFFLSIPLFIDWNREEILRFIRESYYFNYSELSLVSRDNLILKMPKLEWVNSFFILAPLIITFSLLLISNLPLFALKFKKFGWKENQIRYVFLGISVAMLIIFQVLAIPFIILLYLLMSVINNFTLKQ